jgi:hypothetical protein
MNYKLTDKDIEELNAYMEPYFKHAELTKSIIDTVYSYFKGRNLSDIKDFDILYRGNHKNLIHVYDFFQKEKNINAFEYCEQHLSNNSANSHLLNFFRVNVDAKKYIQTDANRSALIKGCRHVNRADLDNLIKIALATENNEAKFDNFLAAISKQKSFNLNALAQEKINDLFIKKFPQATSSDKEKVYTILPSLNKNTYLEEDSGYFYKIKIDCDILSKANKISASNNSIAISNFFKAFNTHIQRNKSLDLKEVEVTSDDSFINKKTLSFNFHNDTDFENKKLLIGKLLSYCLENDGKTLNGSGMIKDDKNFFNTFLLHESMTKNLGDKPGKAPKTKI